MSPSPEARSPLENTTNGPSLSPRGATAKTGPVLRHKPSNRALHPWLDSSESYPSPHSSIYEASLVHSSTEHVSWHDAKDWTIPPAPDQDSSPWPNNEQPASWATTVIDASGNAVPASFLQATPSPKTHTPHKLFPITEQNSLATLRPGASTSTLKPHPSPSTTRPLSPGLNGKKQKSFSTSDLPKDPTSTPSPPPSPQHFYTPIEPHRPPPIRMSTPPRLPKFNTPAASAYRLPPPTVRFRDRFRAPTPAEREWTMQTVGLPRGVVMRGDGGVLIRGKFSPIRSGHFPPQRQQHAFFRVGDAGSHRAARERAPMPSRPVGVDGRVRFSGPRLQARGGVQEGAAPVPVSPATGGGTLGGEGRSERVLRGFYWVVGCCGGCERWEKAAERGSGCQRGFEGGGGVGVGETPLFVGGFRAGER